MAQEKERLDRLLARRALFASREQARRAIMAGRVRVEGRLADKPGTPVPVTAEIVVVGPPRRYVSRGGEKLEHALDHFAIEPQGWICLDVGASTGGFTDCLLQRGARRVYAVDVGRGQLDHGLRQDPRVVVMEGVNARYLEPDALPEPVRLVTVDVSFISLAKLVPALCPLLAPGGLLLPLIKPQFEVGRREVGKGGVVRDEAVRTRVIEQVAADLAAIGFELRGIVDSPVRGAKGNREAFACLERLP
jgi:23S rRNA (cytidine1920-2'-O)/16S rRNA (cytidine1409-2'-O)-methyltransferase